MPTTKKRASKKKASTKKSASKKSVAKSAAKKSPTASLAGETLRLKFPLDAAKAAAIRRCLAKGTLSVTVNKVDLGAGRIGDAWLYD
jgi:anti-sigma28 factor (negative regulator of flagellin synthesis)